MQRDEEIVIRERTRDQCQANAHRVRDSGLPVGQERDPPEVVGVPEGNGPRAPRVRLQHSGRVVEIGLIELGEEEERLPGLRLPRRALLLSGGDVREGLAGEQRAEEDDGQHPDEERSRDQLPDRADRTLGRRARELRGPPPVR